MPEMLIPTITSIGGGFFAGVITGYFVKKITKILMFVAGGIVGLLLYLQQQQIILVNLDKVEESSTFIFTSLLSSFNNIIQIGDNTSLGIPMAVGFSTGFVVGLMKG